MQGEIVEEDEYFIAVSEEFNKILEQQRETNQHVLDTVRQAMLVAGVGRRIGWIDRFFLVKSKMNIVHVLHHHDHSKS